MELVKTTSCASPSTAQTVVYRLRLGGSLVDEVDPARAAAAVRRLLERQRCGDARWLPYAAARRSSHDASGQDSRATDRGFGPRSVDDHVLRNGSGGWGHSAFLDQCSYVEVAEASTLPLSTVESALVRARQQLRLALAGAEHEP